MYNTQQYSQYYNAYYSHYAQYQQYQQQQQQQANPSAPPSNAPPGFSSSVIPQSDGPRPPFFSTANQHQSPIRFNINTPGKPRLVNPLQQQQQQMQHQFVMNSNQFGGGMGMAGDGSGNNNGNNKKKKKKNKNKNNQMMMSPQVMTGPIYNAPVVPTPPQLPVAPPPLPLATPALPTVPATPRFDMSVPPPPIPGGSPVKPLQDSSNNAANAKKSKPDPFNNPTDAWPDSLNNYVTRCYAKCKTDFDKDQVDICLKGRITAAATKGELWTRDWDNEPIPSVFSERNNIQIQMKVNPMTPSKVMKKDNNNWREQPSAGRNPSMRLSMSSSSNRSRSRSPMVVGGGRGNRKRRSRSRSRSQSPRRKSSRRSSSSDASTNDFRSSVYGQGGKAGGMKGNKNNNNNNNNNPNKPLSKKQQKLAAKKAAFYRENGMIGGDVDGDSERLQQRAARFDGRKGGDRSNVTVAENPFNRKKKLQAVSSSRLFVDDNAENNFDLIDFHIVGTCRDLEKNFLRLTKAPAAHEVRPEDVLTHSLQNVKSKWVEKQDYHFACGQLKSIRQDLTVSE